MPGILDRAIGKRGRAVFLIILCLVPTLFVARKWDPQHGFTKLLGFGWSFEAKALPQVRALSPVCESSVGSDGEFYVQLAIDPSLRDPNLAAALDDPEYRARRIFLPLLAWCVGFAQPAAIITAYALLNLFFWYLLAAVLIFSQRPVTVREWLCMGAILWTSGALISIWQSFLDLPAATLLAVAAVIPWRFKPATLALAILTKEAYAICAWAGLAGPRPMDARWWQTLSRLGVMIGPVIIWMLYVHSHFYGSPLVSSNYGWPMNGWWHAIAGNLLTRRFYGSLAAMSLLVQLLYLVIHPQPHSFLWKAGIAFGIAAIFLSPEPFINVTSFARDLLPLAIAFNILFMKERRSFTWFVLGNGGLLVGLIRMVQGIVWP